MSLSSYRVPFLIPYFVEMQRKSFLNLLNIGLVYELSKKNPISRLFGIYKDSEIVFYPKYYQLSRPKYTIKQTILKSKTYASKLYIPVQVKNSQIKSFDLIWVFIGNFPLMTKRGHFILNGSPRVIVNQIGRSPGIYYKEAFDTKKRKKYYADLIPNRGTWLRLEIDVKKRVWAKMKNIPKIPIGAFLKAVGIDEYVMSMTMKESELEFLDRSEFLQEEKGEYYHPESMTEALQTLYEIANPTKTFPEMTLEIARNFLFRKFFNHRTYDLGEVGRSQLTKKFQFLTPSTTSYVLTPQDILLATDYLMKLERGVGSVDDIDNLKNRRVKASGELIQNELRTGFIELEKSIRKKSKKENSILNLITPNSLDRTLRAFFGSSPLSQFMDQTNPLAELTHKRRISSLGPGGITRQTAGMAIRGIHPTHYGRICPIETPEGKNAGLVNSPTNFSKINREGFLETPFYSVYQGQVQKSKGVAFLSADQEEYITIAPGDLKTNYLDFLPFSAIPVRASGEFKKSSTIEIQYMALSPIQMISIATCLIPFLEHDDANRALMGSNMQRQAVPLLIPEKATVGTGLEARVISDSGHGIQAETHGFVSYVSGKTISISTQTKIKKNTTNFLSKNFFYIPELVFPTNCLPFQTKVQNTQIISNYLVKTSTKTLIPSWKGFTKSNFTEYNEANLNRVFLESKHHSGVFEFHKNKVYTELNIQKNLPINFLSLNSYNKNFFNFYYSEKDTKENSEKDTKGNIFYCIKKLVIREHYLSKIHFFNLSKKNLQYFFHYSKNISDFNLFFTKNMINECIKLIFTQVYIQKKNSKNNFFSTSSAWKNSIKKKFSKIKLHKKPVLFYKNSPFVTSKLNLSKTSKYKSVFQKKIIVNCDNENNSYFQKNRSSVLFFHFSFPINASLPKIMNRTDLIKPASLPKPNLVQENQLFSKPTTKSNDLTLASHEYESSFFTKIKHPIQSYPRSNQNTSLHQRPAVYEGDWVRKGDLLADGAASVGGELTVGKTILVAYMPWEGYNFEDAILISERLIYQDLYTSVHIERYEVEIQDNEYGKEIITSQIPKVTRLKTRNLDKLGIVKVGSWVNEGDIIVGKLTPIRPQKITGYKRLIAHIYRNTPDENRRDTSLRAPKNVSGRVIHVELLNPQKRSIFSHSSSSKRPARVHVYIAEKRKIQVGDKMSGRHGNKGIVSKILPRQDMPYLTDGTPVDMVLNPLGVPSRMNVGQIFECLLGLAAKQLNEQIKIQCFDEMYGTEASRSFTFSKLFQARLKTKKEWLFNPNFPGKTQLFDGRTGECFHETITVGEPYILKLIHLVDEKIHARSTGPYALVTQQPVRGRSRRGGQRVGEMEVWAFQGFGAAYTLQEILTIKSDDIIGRNQVMRAILENKPFIVGTSESFKLVIAELQSLCLNIGIYSIDNSGTRKKNDMVQISPSLCLLTS